VYPAHAGKQSSHAALLVVLVALSVNTARKPCTRQWRGSCGLGWEIVQGLGPSNVSADSLASLSQSTAPAPQAQCQYEEKKVTAARKD